MIQIRGLSKQYGSKILFENVELFIGPRARAALIGANGAGKSTLFRLILGLETPDSGEIICSKSLRLGYLAQEVPRFEAGTVLSEVTQVDKSVALLRIEKDKLEKSFHEGLEDYEALDRYGTILTALERFDEARLHAKAKEILAGMGFKQEDFDRPLTEFSGGWLMRVGFCRLLVQEPDLLLLDEPTNHLDLETLLWLEQFLKSYPGALLMISHDTAFLNALADEVVEIDQKKIYRYKGNLSAHAAQKQARRDHLKAQYDNQQIQIAHLEDYINKNRAKASKATQAQSRIKQLEKMDKIELEVDQKTIQFRFPPVALGGKETLSLKDVRVQFEDNLLFDQLTWTIQRGARVAIAGVNGAGKTTFLRLLSQDLEPNSGEVKLGHQVHVGYYAQHQSDSLKLDRTIFDELQAVAPTLPVSQIRGIAGAFLFTGDAVHKKCGVLSGGEKARVALAKLLLSPSNFLILDEPTNHLDADSREMLKEALQSFPGTVCLVTHDRDFGKSLVNSVLEIRRGPKCSEVVELLEDYSEYLERKAVEAAPSSPASKEKEPPKKQSEHKINEKEKKQKDKKLGILEQEITSLENQIHQCDAALLACSPSELQELGKKRQKIVELLREKESQWEVLGE